MSGGWKKNRDIFRRDKFTCQICAVVVDTDETGKPLSFDIAVSNAGKAVRGTLHLSCDHRLPKVRGGTDSTRNRWTLCTDCNSLKGARSVKEFIAWLRLHEGSVLSPSLRADLDPEDHSKGWWRTLEGREHLRSMALRDRGETSR